MYQNKENTKNILLYIIDLIGAFVAYFIANCTWLGLVKGYSILERGELFNELGITLAAFVIVIFIFNVNKDFLRRSRIEEFFYSLKINLIFAAVYAVLLFIRGNTDYVSRGVYVCTIIFNVPIMFTTHCIFKYYLTKVYSRKKKNVQMFLITTADRARNAIAQLRENAQWISKIYAMAVVDADMVGEELLGVPITSGYSDMVKYVKDEAIDEVFFDVPYATGNSLRPYIMEFENMGVVVHLNIEILENFSDFRKSLSMLGSIPVITFANNYYDANKMMIKRIIDILGSLVGIVITLIVAVFLAPALLIESRGPLIFKQKRVGRNGRYFYIYKFRSMYKDAEERKKALMEQNEMKGLMFKMTDDVRVTKVGKFIRRTSIDELPQFFNVLMGDMSLVGTRPPTVDEFKQYESYHKRRLSMKPGITGMWQVSGRSNIEDFEEVVKLDLQYIDNWSIGLDIKILFKTVSAIFKRKGAK
ncbi:MAG: sugar transferase [Butyrivibrio sp.]|nr:sugar transferase [Butyrivibrio sp.]